MEQKRDEKEMSLTRLESETGINYNDEEKFAIVYTANDSLKKKLDMLCKLHPDQFERYVLTGDDEEVKSYHIPKKCVLIKTPATYSDEQKLKMKERGQRLSARHVKKDESTRKKTSLL
ncbi:hypothetical protein LLG07_02450 [bacterium]|nr:hypothetical protein [bacterium]